MPELESLFVHTAIQRRRMQARTMSFFDKAFSSKNHLLIGFLPSVTGMRSTRQRLEGSAFQIKTSCHHQGLRPDAKTRRQGMMLASFPPPDYRRPWAVAQVGAENNRSPRTAHDLFHHART